MRAITAVSPGLLATLLALAAGCTAPGPPAAPPLPVPRVVDLGVVVAPIKIAGGSGGPARVFALLR